jgi:DNA-binding NtrC family response regulator
LYDDEILKNEHLPHTILPTMDRGHSIKIPYSLFDLETVVEKVTCILIERALVKCKGNIAKSAKLTSLPRGSLRYKIKKYGINTMLAQ